ncbi:MAG TPA: mucoidy inhibitor MuiA family protein [Tepidisphaeraceae bacterium]|nr:mucoidy inhibitor MuiA family protein [Tepidisphaeraceae bacterium]
MRSRSVVLALLSLLTSFAAVASAADPLEAAGKIDAVTVYRGQALVTRRVDVPGPVGLKEVVVTGLPEQVVPGSLFAEADAGAGIEVRSVRYRTRPVLQDVRDDVRKLDDQIRAVQDDQTANTRQQQVDSERKVFLDKLEDFAAPTASMELTKGVLNADTLKTLTLFIFDQRQALASDDLKLAKESRDLNEQLAVLQRQRDDLTAGASKLVREAVVFANFTKPGGTLRVKYLVGNANWVPSYVARAADGNPARPVTVQYDASIQQMTGEDWTDVTMTLSTATPSMVATAPELSPLSIVLASAGAPQIGGVANQPFDAKDYQEQRDSLQAQQRQLEAVRNSANSLNGPADDIAGQAEHGAAKAMLAPSTQPWADDSELNGIAGKLQVLELIAKDANDAGPPTVGDSEGVSVTYQLPARTSLPSRSDQQSIQIATLPMSGDFYKLAMPVLTSYVYNQATVTNQTKFVLLAGSVASYYNDQFVGGGQLPTVAIGEQFTLGFGIDSSLRATRQLTDKTDTTQGGNRVLNFSYRLAVENFGASPAQVRIVDRLPNSKNNDVKVTLGNTSKPPTGQPLGPPAADAANHQAGILNWSLDVPAQSVGDRAAIIDYQYKLEFDKQLSIAGIAER